MSELSELSQRISRLLETMNLEVPSDTTDLLEDGLLDSLTFIELLVKLEEEFEVCVSLDDLEPDNFRSIHHMASFVLANQTFPKSATRA